MDRKVNEDILSSLGAVLKKDLFVWKVSSVVLTAKVPVIKAFYIPRNRKCECLIYLKKKVI